LTSFSIEHKNQIFDSNNINNNNTNNTKTTTTTTFIFYLRYFSVFCFLFLVAFIKKETNATLKLTFGKAPKHLYPIKQLVEFLQYNICRLIISIIVKPVIFLSKQNTPDGFLKKKKKKKKIVIINFFFF
jgi:hypothetical protein